MTTNFEKVSAMNVAFGNPRGDFAFVDINRVRKQCKNIGNEFHELMSALGADQKSLDAIKAAVDGVKFETTYENVHLDKARDALCDVHVFAYGGHHFMGVDADRDMEEVVACLMTRFVKDEEDMRLTIAKHAENGVTQVYVEGAYPTRVVKSAVDQPDAPQGKFLKSASYREPVFYNPLKESDRRFMSDGLSDNHKGAK